MVMPPKPWPRPRENDERPEVVELLRSLKKNLPGLRKLLKETDGHWVYEDGIYRFYHQSFKVFFLEEQTTKIVKALEALRPGKPLNKWFLEIIADGTGKKFDTSMNERWLKETRSIVEAFFHAKYFLEMAVRYGRQAKAPSMLPSGWAAFLYLYNLR